MFLNSCRRNVLVLAAMALRCKFKGRPAKALLHAHGTYFQASAVLPMYCLMRLGFYSARAVHLDSAQYRGLEIFLGKYVMPAVNFYMLAKNDMYG